MRDPRGYEPDLARTPWLVAFLLVVAVGLAIVSITKGGGVWLPFSVALVILAVFYLAQWRRWKKRLAASTDEQA